MYLWKYRSLERADNNGRALPLSLRCLPPSASLVREGSRITQNTPQKNETTFAINRFSLHVSICIITIITLCHGLYGHRPGRWSVQRSSGKAAGAIISSHQVAWQQVWKVGLLTHETQTRQTAYIHQSFKTKPWSQTVHKESGVLDDSIRQPAHGLKNCLQHKVNFKCAVRVYSNNMFTGNGS